VTSIADDGHGSLWLASARTGVTRFHDGKFTPFTVRQGLKSNQVYSILVDRRGDLWMGSAIGVLHVPARDLEEVAAGRATTVQCDVLGADDGLRSEECSGSYPPAAALAADGSLWFATKSGVVRIDPERRRRNLRPPPVYVEQLVADGASHAPADARVLPPGVQKLEFHFTALSLVAPSQMRFRYRLVGYDAEWTEATGVRMAQYTKIPPGHYEFRVLACNNDGVWNEAGARHAFTLQPRYYETKWFLSLCVVALFGSVFGLHRWRVRGMRRRQTELEQAVSTRTLELSQANRDLSSANSELKHQIAERERLQQHAERIHPDLMHASHQAGMAEVATGVLHNVGNALNSVNVSAEMVSQAVSRSKLPNIQRVVLMLLEHRDDLPQFLTEDPKGRNILPYLDQALNVALGDERALARETQELRANIEHIRHIVEMQQRYAKLGGVAEKVRPAEIMDDALRINATALARHGVEVAKEYSEAAPEILIEKNKALQILVNFIQNAKYACDDSGRADRRIRLVIEPHADAVVFRVIDNGVGLSPDRKAKLFTYGFTTRKDGHGFGLHTAVLAARELGGAINARSDGEGLGATFELVVPVRKPGVE
jgi:signal transduction histidine kinase